MNREQGLFWEIWGLLTTYNSGCMGLRSVPITCAEGYNCAVGSVNFMIS